MKLDDLRRLRRGSPSPEPAPLPEAPPPGRASMPAALTPEMEARLQSSFQLDPHANAPTLHRVEVPLVDFVTGSAEAQANIHRMMLTAGWPAETRMRIEADEDIAMARRTWTATLPSDNARSTPKVQLVRMDAGVGGVALFIPEPITPGDFLKATTNLERARANAMLRELIRTYGWPPDVRGRVTKYDAAKGRLWLDAFVHDTSDGVVAEAEVVAVWSRGGKIADMTHNFYERSALEVSHVALVEMAK